MFAFHELGIGYQGRTTQQSTAFTFRDWVKAAARTEDREEDGNTSCRNPNHLFFVCADPNRHLFLLLSSFIAHSNPQATSIYGEQTFIATQSKY